MEPGYFQPFQNLLNGGKIIGVEPPFTGVEFTHTGLSDAGQNEYFVGI
jgi:hypothetical protein